MSETISGVGSILNDDTVIEGVDYNLTTWTDDVDGMEGLSNTEGFIDSNIAYTLFGKKGLILRLKDGRAIDFFVKNTSGEIICSGGFYSLGEK